MTFFPKTVTADRTPTRKDGEIEFAPVSLPGNHSGDGKALEPRKSSVQIMSMKWVSTPGHDLNDGRSNEPVMTVKGAARMLGITPKRLSNVICEEKARIGRLPAFVGDGEGKLRRLIIKDELLAWIKARRKKMGRPPKWINP